RSHVPEVDASNFQFHRRRECGLVELAVARIVIVVAVVLTGDRNGVIGPVTVHFTIESVCRPRAAMSRVKIGCNVARVGNRNMADEDDGAEICGVRVILSTDQITYIDGRRGAAYIVADHPPTASHQIELEADEFVLDLP